MGGTRWRNRGCSVDGCEAPHDACGFCASHYARWRRYGEPTAATPEEQRVAAKRAATQKPCSVCGEVKALEEFTFDHRRVDGRQARCMSCTRIYSGAHRIRHPTVPLTDTEREERQRQRTEATAAYRKANREICNARIREWKKRNPYKAREYDHRRRARKMAVAYEAIDALYLAERDGWVCGICDLPIDSALRWPEYGSLSIDHIVPLSRGGSHTYANVRISHVICNIRRGTARGEDLGMILLPQEN